MKNVLKAVWVQVQVAWFVVGWIFNRIEDHVELGAPEGSRHEWHKSSGCGDSPIRGTYDHSSSYYSSSHDD